MAMRRHVLEDLRLVRLPSDPSISPDGSRVAYVLTEVDGDENKRSLWWVGRDGTPRPLTRGKADTAPRFSPDGRTIAFLRDKQVWLLPADGGEPEQLTELPLGAGPPVWSPDSGRIAFAAAVNATPPGEPVVSERPMHKVDGVGRLGGLGSQVFVVDLADRSVTQVTDGTAFAGTPAWSPDGTRLAFADQLAGDGDMFAPAPAVVLNLSTSDIELVGDDKVLAVSWHGDDLVLVAMPGTEAANQTLVRDGRNLAAELDRNVMPGGGGYPGALPQAFGQELLFCARDNGCTHLYSVKNSGVHKLVGGGRVISGLSVANGSAAVIVSTVDIFAEVAFLDPATGDLSLVTSYASVFDDVVHVRPEPRAFTISDGIEVRGWLRRDPSAPTPGPLLVDVHGGPHNAWSPVRDWIHLYHQVLVAQGWTVLLLNPRGSDGYGEKFLQAALGAWGEADERDFLEAVDSLVAEGIADPDRVALTGYSYGGYMSCWLPTRTDRFAAVVAGGVISDLTSAVGTSDAGPAIAEHEIGGPDRLAALSPLAHVAEVTSPTLILHGEADQRCPIGQAEQWFHALHDRGVPTRLVVYPGASHLFVLDGKPSHRLDYQSRIVAWLDQYAGKRS